ncbi:EAL domain-containing protein [Endozoicomonas sp.]|uniref:EAL domain-containing response regulator n=1 Tax=Endozoicomonas sp. TaxID=1892382 RepID=UPI0028852E14|nr:EAL domain-containing protein [Endozoicomonas sp.]
MALGGKDTIRFLIIDSSPDEAESFLNIFRESGYSTRASLINTLDELTAAMSGHQHWDLLLMTEPPPPLNFSQIFDYINQKDIDLPGIILTPPDDEMDLLSLLKMGARAVIPLGNNEYLLTVAQRELEDLKIRRHHRRMSVALYESEKQRRLLLDDQVDPVVYVCHGRIQYANPAFMRLTRRPDEMLLEGQPFKNVISPKDQEDVEAFLLNVEDSGQAFSAIQCLLVDQNGSEIPIRATISATAFDGEFTLSLQIYKNEQEGVQQGVDEVLKKYAPDAETGLFSPKQFELELDVAIESVVLGHGKGTLSLCCIHIETLREVHEQHGREVSQQLMRAVARKLTTLLNEKHPVTSQGGGNFIALLRAGSEVEVSTLGKDLIAAVSGENMVVGQHQLPVKLSLGAVMLCDTNTDPELLIAQSRQAAALAQKKGGSQLCFHKKRKVCAVQAVQKQLAGMVSQALKYKKFRLSYQPVISLSGSSAEYYEVSFSMTDAHGREHAAATFQPKLEKNSLWNKVDRWQLIEASKALMVKRKEGSDTRLLIHIGGYSVTDDTFLPWMKVALKAAGIPTTALAIELSEQNIGRYAEAMPGFFRSVKELGCQTVISEFGCSLNPLAAIAHLDVDLIKLDPSFTQGISEGNNVEELQKMIEALNESGRKVIVPGIETVEEMTPVWQFGAHFIQGSYMQSPSDHMDFDFGSDG